MHSNLEKVFIAGAGPVGLAAAVELMRRGYNPRIVDTDPAPSPESRALAVNPRTLDLLEPSGVTEMLLAAGLRAKKVVIRFGLREVAILDLTHIPHRFNFLLVLAQSKTEEILANRLVELGGKLERNLSLTGFNQASQLEIELSDGKSWTTDYLIGADGSHSTVRKALGIGFPGAMVEEEFGLADVELASWPYPFDTMVLTVLETHLAPFVPMAEGFGRFISTRPDCLNSLPPDARVNKVIWSTDFRISYRHAATYQKGNVFLAGDSAHIHSPVGGRGMNLGIEDACWLAWLIEQGNSADYTRLRHPIGESVLRFTYRFTEFAKSRSTIQNVFLRNVLPIATRFRSFENRAFRMLSALDTPPPPWLHAVAA
jgi:2-polyprenyl-6-methoxyphenol hydroxylase-like FAD-dependent oxidoreductase